MLRAITGHHGRSPLEPNSVDLRASNSNICRAALDAYVADMLVLLRPPELPAKPSEPMQKRAAW